MSKSTNAIHTDMPPVATHLDPSINAELQPVMDTLSTNQKILSDLSRFIAKTTEDISAGDYVAIHLSGSLCKVRKANAADNTKVAVGFAITDVASGTWGVFVLGGNNVHVTGLTVGSFYYLSDVTSGGVTSTKPVGAGKIVQPIGFALTDVELITNISLSFTQL